MARSAGIGSEIEIVFLDRDGVINEEVDLLHHVDQLRLIPGAASAIAQFNQMGLPVAVVTNQPVVARGLCTEDDIQAIHEALRKLLAAEGAHVDVIEFCPHHENANLPEYRTVCECRKPRPGMLLRAAARLGVDPSKGIIIGDRTGDIRAGQAAGCKTILVRTGYGGLDGQNEVTPDAICADLKEAAIWISLEKLSHA